MPDAIAIQAYFSQLDEGFQFMKMVELTKRRPNAWNIMETGQKIATQKLMFSQGQSAQQVANNPQAPAGGQPQPPSPKIAELEKRITELENKLNSVDNQDDIVEDNLTEWEEDMDYKLDALLNHLGVQV